MKIKTILISVSVALILAMALFFLTNPSYKKSLEAQYYYDTGEYELAYDLAQEAFALDLYNRMASTIMAQSKTAMKYTKYIVQAKEYMRQIQEMLSQDGITDAQRSRIKMMSQIMVESYVKLAPSIITDKELVDEATRYYHEFGKILEKVDN